MLSRQELIDILEKFTSRVSVDAKQHKYQRIIELRKHLDMLHKNLAGYLTSRELTVSMMCLLMRRFNGNKYTQDTVLENILRNGKK